jgi:dTDP-4-dehydrorhamnose 3,5-epimerase
MHTYCDDRGRSLMSIYDHLPNLPGQINASTMYAGAVKAWHRHALQEDYWVVLSGDLKIGLFNTEPVAVTAELRLAGPMPNQDRALPLEVAPNTGQAVYLGEHRPGVLRIPARLWHGGVATGGRDALLLYHVTRKYDPANPDEERAPWNRFDFSWAVEHK